MKFARSSVMLLSGTGLALAGRNASQATYQEMPPRGPGVRRQMRNSLGRCTKDR